VTMLVRMAEALDSAVTLFNRQHHLELRPTVTVGRRNKFTAVKFNNLAANSQSQSHSMRFRSDECGKNAA